MIGVMVPNVYAETWYYYVEPLPEYASYANNVMELSTTAWEDANDNLQFIEVSSPQQANFQVQWVKEFGVEHVGYAYGSWFIEVGLGDSNCGDGMWQPYSEQYTTDIMTHEIGHVLGFDHVNDPDSIMYPVAINWEYGNVEIKETLTSGYGYFQPICTSKDVTTFDWHVSSDDPTYGFDVYFVPSINEFDNWRDGESFNYFEGDGCSAENMLSVGGTCKGVTQDSGLLVIMGDDATEPLTEITLNFQENNSEFTDDASNSEKSSPNQNSNDVILVDTTFSLYVDPQQKFSIKYPSNWITVDTVYDNNKVVFANDDNWQAQIYVIEYGEIEYAGFSDSYILDKIVSYEQEFCDNASFLDNDLICYDFVFAMSDIYQKDSGQNVYVVGYESTIQYDGIPGVEYPTTTILAEIHDGSNAWTVYAEVDTEYRDSFIDILIESIASFEVNTSGENSSTTNSNSIPIPIPQPDVITSTGTAALSKTSVNVSSDQPEQVKIYGIVSNVDKSTRVSITYTYPDGTTDGGTIFTTDTGVYETYLNLDKNSPIGNYEILVTAKGKILGTLILQVKDKILDSHSFVESTPLPTSNTSLNTNGIASFVDQSKDPQYYIDRYNNEPAYKQWFDDNYFQYSSIYEAVGLEEPRGIASFVDQSKDPQHYIDRYNNEPAYKQWFDDNYFQYSSIYEAVGMENPIVEPISEPVPEPVVEYIPEPITEVTSIPNCGIGTIEKDGICVAELKNTSKIKLIPGQWVEYDVSLEFEGSRTMIAMIDKMIKESTTDTGYDIFKVTKLKVEVLEVTDKFVEIERTITMIDDELITTEKIYEISGGTIFAQPFIELPYLSTLKHNSDEDNPFTIESINFNGEKNLTVNNQKIPTLFYRGYTSSTFGEDTTSKSDDLNSQTSLAEYYFEKNTGILVKSKNEITMFGIVPFFGEVDLKMAFILSMTDDYIPKEKSSKGGGCLIATATYGSELAPQVQQLRELRDNQLLNTESGTAFMGTFNDIYYSFSPTIADYERENPYFKEAVKLAITPMISTLSLMETAETESEVLSIGISVIMLNLGMYLGVPAIVVMGIRKKF